MARTPASDGIAGVGKSGSPAPRSITSSPAALRRFASCEMAIVAEVSRCCRLGDRPALRAMGETIATHPQGTQPRLPAPALWPGGAAVRVVEGRCLSANRSGAAEPTYRPLTTEDRV